MSLIVPKILSSISSFKNLRRSWLRRSFLILLIQCRTSPWCRKTVCLSITQALIIPRPLGLATHHPHKSNHPAMTGTASGEMALICGVTVRCLRPRTWGSWGHFVR
ncbi:uncharacterized protein BJX67DRAFT_366122 [Aspergillus lucknowensis]|uniref:Uncharacterized protein n=1 Tax=Aspergillus lucknowensis TaxID=176173 RepID=A0ABR4LDJ8_9EURO